MFNISVLNKIKEELSAYKAELVAVTKNHTANDIMSLYLSGQKVFGENRVQELLTKYEQLPQDIEWHFIGHLQSNKVKFIAPFISLIHSVDSEKLLSVIDKEALKNNRIIDCLLQVHIALEETKFGFSLDEVLEFLHFFNAQKYPGVNIRGLMGMATLTSDIDRIKKEFDTLALLFKQIQMETQQKNSGFNILSMGMSSDYKQALQAGSNMVRIGSLLFG
ncbi:MAG: YggS family pyridoxal phosphate-dependent enzyme [Sphingobacteriales bacterium]|nr:MAG: YggS family pyridoxal phosphate-dependent enzyme [Sphingobacteriales bacterium]